MKKRTLILYGITLLLTLIWVSNYGGALPYLSFYLVLFFPLISAAYLFYIISTMRFYQEISEYRVTKGETVPYTFVIENTGFLPVTGLRFVLEKELCQILGFDDTTRITLMPGERFTVQAKLIPLYAGTYQVGVRKMLVEDCFRWITFPYTVSANFQAIVKPQITDRANAWLNLDQALSNLEMRNQISAESILGNSVHPYQRGDSIRHIHWKNSAKMQELLVRDIEPRQMHQMEIVLVPSENQITLSAIQRRDEFLETIVSIAWYFCQQSKAVTFSYPRNGVARYVVDSFESFQDFYEIITDDIFYSLKDIDWKSWILKNCQNRLDSIWIIKENDEQKSDMVLEQFHDALF